MEPMTIQTLYQPIISSEWAQDVAQFNDHNCHSAEYSLSIIYRWWSEIIVTSAKNGACYYVSAAGWEAGKVFIYHKIDTGLEDKNQ